MRDATKWVQDLTAKKLADKYLVKLGRLLYPIENLIVQSIADDIPLRALRFLAKTAYIFAYTLAELKRMKWGRD